MALYCENGEDISDLDKKKNRTSAAWKYFDVKSHKHKIAICNLCQTYHSYRTTVSNLMKHIRRKHKHIENEDYEKDIRDEDSNKSEDNSDPDFLIRRKSDTGLMRSKIWMYFKVIDSEAKISQCLICQHKLSYKTTITNLKRHLRRKHPNLDWPSDNDDKKIILSSDGQLYELETSPKDEKEDVDDQQEDPIVMDEIYLEDFNEDFDAESEKNTHRKSFKLLEQNLRKKRKLKDVKVIESSDEEELQHYIKKNDALDHFGKYIVSLLAKLPKHVSNKLQVSFVQQIMDAQMKCEMPMTSKKRKNSFRVIERLEQETVPDEELTVPNIKPEMTGKITVIRSEDEAQKDNE